MSNLPLIFENQLLLINFKFLLTPNLFAFLFATFRAFSHTSTPCAKVIFYF